MHFRSGQIEPSVIIESDCELTSDCLHHVTELLSCNAVFRSRVMIKRTTSTIIYFITIVGIPRATFEFIVSILVTHHGNRDHVCNQNCRPLGHHKVRCLDGFPHRRCSAPKLRQDGSFGSPSLNPYSLPVIADLLFEEEFHTRCTVVADGREGRRLFARMMNK